MVNLIKYQSFFTEIIFSKYLRAYVHQHIPGFKITKITHSSSKYRLFKPKQYLNEKMMMSM
jgi:hypothetical protein